MEAVGKKTFREIAKKFVLPKRSTQGETRWSWLLEHFQGMYGHVQLFPEEQDVVQKNLRESRNACLLGEWMTREDIRTTLCGSCRQPLDMLAVLNFFSELEEKCDEDGELPDDLDAGIEYTIITIGGNSVYGEVVCHTGCKVHPEGPLW